MEILLKHTDKRSKSSQTISAPLDPKTGKVWAKDEDMRVNFLEKYNITEETRFTFNPNIPYNKDDEFFMGWLEIAKKLKIVREASEKHISAVYEIVDVEVEASNSVADRQSKYEAIDLVRNLSHNKKIELSKILGFDGSVLSLDRLTEQLFDICETTPMRDNYRNYRTILDLLKDKDYNYRLLFANLIFNGTIIGKEGKYFFQDTFLGTSKEEVLAWMKDKHNKDVVTALKLRVKDSDVE